MTFTIYLLNIHNVQLNIWQEPSNNYSGSAEANRNIALNFGELNFGEIK